MYSRKPHPNLYVYDIVELDTKVHHEILVPRTLTDEEVVRVIADYLKQYEEIYPETRDEEVWMWISSIVKEGVNLEDLKTYKSYAEEVM